MALLAGTSRAMMRSLSLNFQREYNALVFSFGQMFGSSRRAPVYPAARLSALITARPASALLALHTHTSAVALITETIPNALFIPNIRTIITNHEVLSTIPPSQYPEWGWKAQKRTLERLEPHTVTEDLRTRSMLAIRRIGAISRVIAEINNVRSKIDTGLAFQETVYLTKRTQAERFRNSGYDETLLLEIPHLLQYANQASVTLKQAADDILFSANLDDAFLAKTESLRLKYFALIKNAQADAEFSEILDRFLLDCNSKQLV